MYQNQFDGILQQQERNSAYLFYGEADYLIDLYIQKTLDSLKIEEDEVQKVYFDDYDYNYVKDQLSQSSLFASNNVLVVKQNKKIDARHMKELVSVAQSNPDSVVIFAIYINEKLTTHEKYFTPKTDGVVVRFFAPKAHQAINLLLDEARKIGLDITPDALSHLFAVHDENLALCINDLKKLHILDTQIGVKHISKYCSSLGDVSIDKFLHNLLDNNNINNELNQMFEEGVSHVQLVNQISSFIQQLFMINAYSRTHGFADAKEILGYVPPKDIWQKKSVLASKIKLHQYLEMMKYYQDIELELKTNTRIDSTSYLISMLRKHSAIFR
jgi:DNA polymerase-3 subunit delta